MAKKAVKPKPKSAKPKSAKRTAPRKAAAPKRARRVAAAPPADELLVTLEDQPGADEVPLVTLAEEVEETGSAPLVEASPPPPAAPLPKDWSLPEQFLAVALTEDWDDRMEKVKAGSQGAAIAASLLLELALRGRLRLHLDRFQVMGDPTGDRDLDAFAMQVVELGDRKAPEALDRLGRKASQHVQPWRDRLHERGIARQESWRFLGIFPRSRMLITDRDAKGKLENRLQRTLVGGTPDVRTIVLLGLIDAAGLLPDIIPEGAIAFNRKRINALLTGRDPLGYRVDPHIHDLQGVLVAEILRNVRMLQGTGPA